MMRKSIFCITGMQAETGGGAHNNEQRLWIRFMHRGNAQIPAILKPMQTCDLPTRRPDWDEMVDREYAS